MSRNCCRDSVVNTWWTDTMVSARGILELPECHGKVQLWVRIKYAKQATIVELRDRFR